MDILRIARGFDPELVVPGHELEPGHTVWDRLPYWDVNKKAFVVEPGEFKLMVGSSSVDIKSTGKFKISR